MEVKKVNKKKLPVDSKDFKLTSGESILRGMCVNCGFENYFSYGQCIKCSKCNYRVVTKVRTPIPRYYLCR